MKDVIDLMAGDKLSASTAELNRNDDSTVQVSIDGVLDLHNFSPKDLKYLIPDYLDECHKAGIFHVRIIHGKGSGNLRRTVHAILGRLPQVLKCKLADERAGGWGATLVELHRQICSGK
jgi:DNA-nicking Smr family endonuclease